MQDSVFKEVFHISNQINRDKMEELLQFMHELKAADQKKEIEKGQQIARQEGYTRGIEEGNEQEVLKTLKLLLDPNDKTLDTAALAAKLGIKESLVQSLF